MQRRLLELLQRSSYLCLSLTDKGRGLAARQDIPRGTVILTETPLLKGHRCDAGKVCHNCLCAFHDGSAAQRSSGQAYCSTECMQRARGTYEAVEHSGDSGSNFAELGEYCSRHRERFPLLAARLACRVVAQGEACQTYQGLQELCFANVPQPLPQLWAEAHALIQGGLQRHVSSLPAGSEARQVAADRAAAVTPVWVASVLARLHVNTFRVDCVFPLPKGRSLADMAAAIIGGGSDGHSGSAVFLLASLFNHSCMPNCDVAFPQNNATIEVRAACDIARGEELCITYIDVDAPFRERQEQLAFAYGFKCACALCMAQEKDLHMDD